MSRETDSSSSGPHGRGGPSYTPGADPYGDPGAGEPSERAAAGGDARAPADEPKTETTLTTRIRINIPGSRPIPPVVMRKTVGEGDDDARAERDPADGNAADRRGAGAGSPAPSGPGSASDAAGGGAGAAGAAAASGAGGAGAGGGEPSRSTSDWFAPRKPPRPAPEPDPVRDDERAGEDGGRTATPPDGFPAVGRRSPAPPPPGGLGDFLDGPPPSASASGSAAGPRPGPAGPPAGRTAGPRTGDMPLPPPPGGRGADDRPLGPPPGPGGGYDPFGRPAPAGPPPGGLGAPGGAPGPSLYAQGAPGAPGDERVTSDTLVSGIPRMPSVDSVFPPDAPAPTPAGHGYFDDDRGDRPGPDDGADRGDRGDRDDGGRGGKGRSKLVLAGVSLVGVVAIAYGAGLLLDHADVPNNTTVLGVDIGGKSQQDAVNTLDAALESRMTDPLTLVVDGKEKRLKPEVVGLTIDTEETVREASGRDYNPLSVIGSLFGGSRVVEAQVQVDDAKLRSAVGMLSERAVPGSGKDGMVVFTGGKAKAVPGKAHKAVDVGKAANRIEDAYRERAATGQAAPITLPVSTQQPEIGEQELQAAVDGFGKTAMSGWVWLQAGDVQVPFSQQTIGTFLTMQPGGDTLQPVIDTEKLAATYGSAFDGVVIDGGAGTVPMTAKHAAAAMVEALREPAPPAPEKRIAQVPASQSR